MDEPDEFEIAKMEIRGLLISNKEGCSLAEFKKQYRSMLGRALPFVQLGYKNEIELLSAMSDAVHLTPSGRDYYLYGIADEKSKHIQKMVSRQKTTTKRKPLGRLNPMQRYHPPPSSAPRRSYELPPSSAPRWSNELASSAARRSNELPPSYRRPDELPPSSRRPNELPPSSRRPNELPTSSAPKRTSELPPSSNCKRSYEVPPRFQTSTKIKKELPQSVMKEIVNLVSKYPTGLSLRDVLMYYRRFYDKELSFRDYGFFTLQECLEEIPSLILKPEDNDTIVMTSPDIEKSYSEPSKTSNKVSSDSSATFNKAPKISEVASPTVQRSEGSGLSVTTALNRPNFELPSYDPFSVSTCPPGFSFPSAGIHRPNSELHSFDPFSALNDPSDSSNHLYSDDLCSIPSPRSSATNCNDHDNHGASNLKTKANQLDDFSCNTRESPDDSPVSEKIRDNLIRVVENFHHGIWARDFPAVYKEITKTEFDLHSLGFYDLASFIDSVPDILTRRSLPNSKKDYLLYPAWTTNEMDREDPKSAAFALEIIIGNTRKILQANQEGITLKEFLYVYSLNCSEPLYYVDLGFNSLESLLFAIADRIPLKFETKEGVKSVILSEEKSFLPPPVDFEPLPSNVISPFRQFTQQTLHPEMDLSQFFPVYVCSVINPGHIYIQLQGEDTSEALLMKYKDLEKFYSSSQSKSYVMKEVHIAAGSIGVALWPVDMHWYRIRIMSVLSPETVRVFYVDYGTIEIIPKSLLRYIREEFFDLPTQAIKASLAYAKPALGVNSWNPRAKSRILELCTDITVMTKIRDIEQDGLLSVVLCDTNGEEDVYINDVLLREHLVNGTSDADSHSQCRTPQEPPQCVPEIPPPTLPAPNPLSANAADPTQVIGMLLQAYSSLAANKASTTAPANFPMDPALITAALAQAAQNLSPNPSAPGVDFSNVFQMPTTSVTSPIPSPKPPTNEGWQFPPTSLDYPGDTASLSSYTPPSEESSEVFDDVDDAFFDEFYQKVSLVTKRYVKRIRTGDGYMFHILIYESKPFVSCGDICSLIWSNKDSDYLLQRLQNQESNLTNTLVWENQNEDMFDQLRRFHVKGFKELNEQTCILVYSINTLVQILNIFGHPSAELRSRILSESSSFNPKHPMWMELSEVEIPDGDEEFAGKTDDDKLNRLCLYDLQTMKQGIRIRRQNLELRRSKSPEDVSDEEEKLRLLYNKVIGRIKEIQQICSNFADA